LRPQGGWVEIYLVMAEEGESNGTVRFVRVVLPWVLAAGMLAVYLITLNHWVSPESLSQVANVSGLNPRTELLGPVTFLVTMPFRWLPAAWIPPALNLFAAVCAALSLAWLARSVALLPCDRTEAQRNRLQEGISLLTLRSAWLPPTLAVLICGLQVTFWEHAVAATGEMFDLLLFAYLVRSLVELRADGKTGRLLGFGFVYGLAVANNWAMVAFAPLLWVAAVWAARANPFRVRVLEQAFESFSNRRRSAFTRLRQGLRPFNLGIWAASFGCFLGGLSLLLLLPAVASMGDNAQMDFWPALHLVLRTYKRLLLSLPKVTVVLLCLASVMPALFMTIRWGSVVGGARAADQLVAGMFHGLHGFFLVECLWAALDLPLSPRRLNVGFACLPLYYLIALNAGYFSSYFLLVFGAPAREGWRRSALLTRLANLGLTVAIWATLVIVPALMLRKNVSYILWNRTGALGNFTAQLERSLPPAGAVLLSDNSFRLRCLETALVRRGQQRAYLPIDVSLLAQDRAYFEFLQQRHPEFRLAPPVFQMGTDLTNVAVLTTWVRDLATERDVYFLHPLVGRLGESFFAQPHGLLYQIKAFSTNDVASGPLPSEVVAENQSFWRTFTAGPMTELVRHIPPPEQLSQGGSWQQLHQTASLRSEPDRWAAAIGGWYARALDAWGVELARANLLAEAGDCFAKALQLSPDNVAAQVNRDFNQDLQAHKPVALQPAQQLDLWLGKRRSWDLVLAIDGPIDEPTVAYKIGTILAAAGLPRQAAQQFLRVQALVPGQVDVALRLAEQYLALADYTNALAAANQCLQLSPRNPDGLFLKGCSLMLRKDYEQALPVLKEALSVQANSRAGLAIAYAHLQLGDLAAARQDYERAARSLTNTYLAYLGLSEVAYLQKDTNAAIKYSELCQSNAPPNLPPNRIVEARLAELRGGLVQEPKP
jgi:tetratricopeptide (TPR) repeat protein